MVLLIAAVSCGGDVPAGKLPGSTPRSHVTPLFKPVSLNESHGDGRYATFTIKMPLSETSIDPVNSPIDPRSGISRLPIFGDVLRLVGQATLNFATRLTRAGDQKIIISQPIPELDTEIVKHVSIKRVFFQVKKTTVPGESRRRPNLFNRVVGGVRRVIRGSSAVNFDFIDELKINMRMTTTPLETISWLPDIVFSDEDTGCNDTDPRTLCYVEERRLAEQDVHPPFRLMHYRKGDRARLTNALAPMFTYYTDKPVELQRIFRRIEEFRPLIKEMTKVGKSLIIELKQGPAIRGSYQRLMRTHARDFAEVPYTISECDRKTCMDVKVDQTNLLPMLMRGNTLKIDTNMDLDEVPPSDFQLRGFLEFEIKIDSPL